MSDQKTVFLAAEADACAQKRTAAGDYRDRTRVRVSRRRSGGDRAGIQLERYRQAVCRGHQSAGLYYGTESGVAHFVCFYLRKFSS